MMAQIDHIGALTKLYKAVDKKRKQFNKKFSLGKVNFDVDMHNVKNNTNIPKPFGGKTEYDLKQGKKNKDVK
tara:strand:+ start:289 stop:504 length:216 start_codon:yes stop_codon:yes gene_type:complete